MRLLIDENCAGRDFVKRLRSAGHDVETTIDALGAAASDLAIVAYAIAQARALVTKDVDDFRVLFADRKNHSGLLLIYEEHGKPKLSTDALARAIDNVARAYAQLDSCVIALNDFVW